MDLAFLQALFKKILIKSGKLLLPANKITMKTILLSSAEHYKSECYSTKDCSVC